MERKAHKDLLGYITFESFDEEGQRLISYINRTGDIDDQLNAFFDSLQIYLKTGEKV